MSRMVTELCPVAKVYVKTTSSIRSQYGSLSWQRLWHETRVMKSIAHEKGWPVIDSFVMTQPLVMELAAYPDTVHLYEQKLVGNWASKSITMLFLNQMCNTTQRQ